MSQQDEPTRAPARPGPYIAVAVILAAGIVLPLVVPIYARQAPSFIGLPFFYWYQMLWVVIEAVLLLICYRILRAEDRRRRAALTGGAASEREARS
ncbi:DUF3311 domain-containing protein [Amnibacterium sp.]|uniref:DUF3311 domain-containing protein n=1 Tax=Amnibacterium sp. TaxID=1872496 RepID=UPI003F7CA715